MAEKLMAVTITLLVIITALLVALAVYKVIIQPLQKVSTVLCVEGVDCTSEGKRVISEEMWDRAFMCREQHEALIACMKGIKTD